ncbi:MAG: Ig-like domain-containing protein [Chitinophagales bacterium]
MRRILKLYIAVLFLLSSCASVFNPPGGPTDEEPPKNISAEPEMLAKNVKTKKFVFEFDEFIKLNNPYNEVLISPPLDNRPEYKIKGKKLILTIDDTLQPQTTYTINFGQAIADNNEGNKLIGLNYVFSTGDFIDSLSISGNIRDAYTNSGAKNAGVLLYRDETFTDTSFQKTKPFYYAMSNESGAFQFKYLRAGKYRVFVLQDENFNIQYDPPGEKIGFLDTTLHLKPDIDYSLNLSLFKNESTAAVVAYEVDKQNIVSIMFNKEINELEVLDVQGFEQKIHQNWNITGDTLKLYYLYNTTERPRIILKPENNELDTLEFRSEVFNKDSAAQLPPLWNPEQPKRTQSLELAKPIPLSFERPVQLPVSGIHLYEDSFKREKNIRFAIDSLNPKQLLISTDLKPETRYDLVVTESSVNDHYGNANKAFKLEYRSKSVEDYGNLSIELTELDAAHQYIFELIRESKVIDKIVFSGQETFQKSWKYLKPGNLQFRVILDKDKNNRWTSGNIEQKTQPEPIYIYPEQINIRGNWDMELEDAPNFDLH